MGELPAEATALNVEGRQMVGPLQGFGQIWQKTYRVRLTDVQVSPDEVVSLLKQKLPEFMPDNSRFYPSVTGLEPGEVVLINATLPGVPGVIATDVLVVYSDDESFTLMCPEGHPESGWNTFSACEEDGATVAQIQSLARANDPVFEFGFRFMGGSREQERIWDSVLTRLAEHYGVVAQVETRKSLVDSQIQWSQARNVWYNAALRSLINLPVRITRRVFKRGSSV